jgi:hypothetical protein
VSQNRPMCPGSMSNIWYYDGRLALCDTVQYVANVGLVKSDIKRMCTINIMYQWIYTYKLLVVFMSKVS